MSSQTLKVTSSTILAFAVSGGGGLLPSGHYVASSLPLTMVAPFSGLTTANRYYRQYPGIAYRVPVVAYGGAWPYVFDILQGPTGLVVGRTYLDYNYGIMTWTNPVAGTYTCQVQVTDQLGVKVSTMWTLTVTTSNFIFVDPVNGHASSNNGGTGTGTLANPFLTLNDWYAGTSGSGSGTRFDTTYQNYFVIYRAGSLSANTCFTDSNGIVEMQSKPTVHLAYPGETVSIDFQTNLNTWGMASGNVALQGITFPGCPTSASAKQNQCIRMDSGGNHNLIFENTFQTPAGAAISGTNPAFVMVADAHPGVAQYNSFIRNTITGTNGYDVFLGYYTQYTVVEGNQISNSTDLTFYPKVSNDTFVVRNNVGLSGNSGTLVRFDGYSPASSNCEACWNNWKSTSFGAQFGPDTGGTVGPYQAYRNTWQIANHEVDNVPVSAVTVVNDVVKYTNAGANSHGFVISGGSITTPSFSGEELVALNGTFVDSSGNLTGSGLAYLGLRGSQIA